MNLLIMMLILVLIVLMLMLHVQVLKKKINDMTDQMIETMKERIAKYSQCFNQSRENYSEPDSSLGSHKPEVSLYDDFEQSYQSIPHLHADLSLPSLEKESNLPVSLSPDLAPHSNSQKDVTDDVLV